MTKVELNTLIALGDFIAQAVEGGGVSLASRSRAALNAPSASTSASSALLLRARRDAPPVREPHAHAAQDRHRPDLLRVALELALAAGLLGANGPSGSRPTSSQVPAASRCARALRSPICASPGGARSPPPRARAAPSSRYAPRTNALYLLLSAFVADTSSHQDREAPRARPRGEHTFPTSTRVSQRATARVVACVSADGVHPRSRSRSLVFARGAARLERAQAGWKLWPFAHIITYGVIPVRRRCCGSIASTSCGAPFSRASARRSRRPGWPSGR